MGVFSNQAFQAFSVNVTLLLENQRGCPYNLCGIVHIYFRHIMVENPVVFWYTETVSALISQEESHEKNEKADYHHSYTHSNRAEYLVFGEVVYACQTS